jgi:predicted small secreted protein
MTTRTCLLLLALAALALVGCNAVKGLGTDIHDGTQHVQNWIEGASDDHAGTYGTGGQGQGNQVYAAR